MRSNHPRLLQTDHLPTTAGPLTMPSTGRVSRTKAKMLGVVPDGSSKQGGARGMILGHGRWFQYVSVMWYFLLFHPSKWLQVFLTWLGPTCYLKVEVFGVWRPTWHLRILYSLYSVYLMKTCPFDNLPGIWWKKHILPLDGGDRDLAFHNGTLWWFQVINHIYPGHRVSSWILT